MGAVQQSPEPGLGSPTLSSVVNVFEFNLARVSVCQGLLAGCVQVPDCAPRTGNKANRLDGLIDPGLVRDDNVSLFIPPD
ncbi:MAG: hypothetical protein AKCLJLPJ_00407 [Fimbriimonadales bacterium]|nr:hypothetical protein [Fimbriimonadales bacterium]MDL1929632.1 hypothetical protein [Fimbriimonadia bacterium ATM]NOG93099.1 hypothetical protein [Armatimonadota bacterium]